MCFHSVTRSARLLDILNFNDIFLKEVDHLLGALKHVLLHILVCAIKTLNEVLFLIVMKFLNDINHQNTLTTISLLCDI